MWIARVPLKTCFGVPNYESVEKKDTTLKHYAEQVQVVRNLESKAVISIHRKVFCSEKSLIDQV